MTAARPTGDDDARFSRDAENTRARYWERVRAKVTRALNYPTESRRRCEEGRVVVRIVLARDGQLARLESTTGGSPALLEAARKAVEAAAPFPAPDFPLDGETIAADLPIRFTLEQP